MESYDKEVLHDALKNEKKILDSLKKTYKQALKDINDKIAQLKGRTDVENMQSIIYQMDYQKALKKQIKTILDDLNTKQFDSVSKYLTESYEEGYLGTMYALQKQGIPLIMPIDQKSVVKAIVNNTKLSKKLYAKLGEDVNELNKRIQAEISRGMSQGYSYSKIAQNVAGQTSIGFNKAMRIVKTESHRIRNEATLDAQKKAKAAGADIVKQWDATLDKKVRPTHKILDGQIQDIDKPFVAGTHAAMNPGGFGVPGLDINCRCALLQRAKWALDEEELDNLKKRAEYFGLDKTESFEDFKKKYMEAASDVEGWDLAKDMINSGTYDETKFEQFSKIHKKHYNYANTVKYQNNKKYGDAWPEDAKKKWEIAKQVSDDEKVMLEQIKKTQSGRTKSNSHHK